MFWARRSIISFVFGIFFLMSLSLSHGLWFRNLRGTSKVAPPHISTAQKPTLSSFSSIGSISSVLILVAKMDWCASRKINSVIPIFTISFSPSQHLYVVTMVAWVDGHIY